MIPLLYALYIVILLCTKIEFRFFTMGLLHYKGPLYVSIHLGKLVPYSVIMIQIQPLDIIMYNNTQTDSQE